MSAPNHDPTSEPGLQGTCTITCLPDIVVNTQAKAFRVGAAFFLSRKTRTGKPLSKVDSFNRQEMLEPLMLSHVRKAIFDSLSTADREVADAWIPACPIEKI